MVAMAGASEEGRGGAVEKERGHELQQRWWRRRGRGRTAEVGKLSLLPAEMSLMMVAVDDWESVAGDWWWWMTFAKLWKTRQREKA